MTALPMKNGKAGPALPANFHRMSISEQARILVEMSYANDGNAPSSTSSFDPAEFRLYANAGAPATPEDSWSRPMTDDQKKFFDTYYDQAKRIGDQYGFDATMLLGLMAHESGWGRSGFATKRNNPFGITPDGRTGKDLQSPEQAFDYWGRLYGPRVKDVNDRAQNFVDRLQLDNRNVKGETIGGDRRGKYNPENERDPRTEDLLGNPEWRGKVRDAITSVRRRMGPYMQTRQPSP